MTTLLTPDSTALAAAVAEEALGHRRPDLVAGFRRQLPRAMDVIARRLVAAAYREGLVGDAVTWADGRATLPAAPGGRQRVAADRHAFARLEFTGPVAGDPADLFERLLPKAGREVRDEITDAAVNLALALARRDEMERDLAAEATRLGAADLLDLWAGSDSDERTVHFERLATEGHNLHPCGRTRLGWRVEDLLAHDLESPVTSVGFVGVRRDLHVGDEIGPELLTERPQVDPDRYAVTPVHPWQMRHLTRGSYTDLVGDGSVVPLDVELPALVSAALRTLLLPGRQRFVKVSLDIQVTSTRRTISVASTRNGPALSRVLPDLIDSDRVLLMAETAGSAAVAPGTPPRNRDLAAILRNGLSAGSRPTRSPYPAPRSTRHRHCPARPSWPSWSRGSAVPDTSTPRTEPRSHSSANTPACCSHPCCPWPPASVSGSRPTCRTACPRSWPESPSGSGFATSRECASTCPASAPRSLSGCISGPAR
jgi:siderophore synthetase component